MVVSEKEEREGGNGGKEGGTEEEKGREETEITGVHFKIKLYFTHCIFEYLTFLLR